MYTIIKSHSDTIRLNSNASNEKEKKRKTEKKHFFCQIFAAIINVAIKIDYG